jgi:hypothetical protein
LRFGVDSYVRRGTGHLHYGAGLSDLQLHVQAEFHPDGYRDSGLVSVKAFGLNAHFVIGGLQVRDCEQAAVVGRRSALRSRSDILDCHGRGWHSGTGRIHYRASDLASFSLAIQICHAKAKASQ